MDKQEDVYRDIREGMKVYDSEGKDVGTVEAVQLPEGKGDGTSSAAPPEQPNRRNVTEFVAEAFRTDKIPDEFQERLVMHGFIQVDSSKLFARDRYVMMDDIAAVREGAVHLKVNQDELKKKARK